MSREEYIKRTLELHSQGAPGIEIQSILGEFTTFYNDFKIANIDGEKGVKETFERAFNEWKNDIVYLTELIVALNRHSWDQYDSGGKLGQLYSDLYYKALNWYDKNYKNFSEEERSFFYAITD